MTNHIIISSRLRPALFRQLREHDRAEHQHAAEDFARRQRLIEQQPAGDGRDNRFQAHDKACDRRTQSLLADDLERVRHARGHRARIQDGLPRGENIRPRRLFKEQHADAREDRASEKLDAGHFYAVHSGRKIVDDENVAGEQERAAETEQRAQIEAEAAPRHAQEVQTGQRDRDAAPVLEAAAAAEQQADQRHDQNIARGHKTCLADRGVQQRKLLRTACDTQDGAAAEAADDKRFPSLPAFLRRFSRARRPDPVQHRDHRQQHDHSDDASRADVGHRPDIVHADALRHERRAPDGRCDQQKQGISQFHSYLSPETGFFTKKEPLFSKRFSLELITRFELVTSSLPRMHSTY